MIPGSNKDHPSFLKSFSYAMEGFVTAVKTERNIKVMLVAGVCTVIAGCIVGLDIAEWATIIICCGGDSRRAVQHRYGGYRRPRRPRSSIRWPSVRRTSPPASVYVLSITAAIVGVLVFARCARLI